MPNRLTVPQLNGPNPKLARPVLMDKHCVALRLQNVARSIMPSFWKTANETKAPPIFMERLCYTIKSGNDPIRHAISQNKRIAT